MGRLVLGIDIGITSVGYGVIDIDNNKFVDYGVRLFKEGTAANNEDRRSKRGARRLTRRKVNRLNDMKKLLERNGLIDKDFKPLLNPYAIRKKGLDNTLTKEELVTAILHITKNRGTCLESNADETDDEASTKGVLAKNELELKDKFICEIQLERLEKEGKIRGTNNNFKTDDYVKELDRILSNQNLPYELVDKMKEIVARRRRYDQGPGSEKSPTPYGSFRFQGGKLVHVNLIDMMRGKCSVFPDQLRAPKQSYSAEMFNFLNDLNNLRVHGNKLEIEDKLALVEEVNKKGNLTVRQLLKILGVDKDDVTGLRVDKNNNPIITEFKGYKKVFKVLKQHNRLDLLSDKSLVDVVMDINTKTKGIEERITMIKNAFASLDDAIIKDFAAIKGVTGYHSLSFKALELISNEMLKTDMNQIQVLHQLDIFNKYRASFKNQRKIKADDTAVLSPVAKRAHRETFKVINRLREIYGEFDSIVIETTRDKNTDEQKKRIKERQKYFESKNKDVEQLLTGAGYDPDCVNAKTKMKVRLYLEQDGKTAYTLQEINLKELIEKESAYEVDHIIPISISLDDSFNNKVLTTHGENQQKGNLSPITAFLKGKFVNGDINKFKTFVKNNKKICRKKTNYLLCEENITKYETVQKFINRNLVDTSYACRTVMTTLSHYFKDNDIDTKIHTIRGQATSAFRKRIGLYKDRNEDYLHHAIDALIVASLKKLNLVNSYLMKIDFDQMYDEKTGEVFSVLPDNSYLDTKYIEFVSTLKNVYEESNKYIRGIMTKEEMHYPLIKISHKIDTKANRKIADDTIYSTRKINGQEKLVERIKNIYDPKENEAIRLVEDIINDDVQKYIMANIDPKSFDKLKDVVLSHFEMYKESKEYYSKDKKGMYLLKGVNPFTLYYEEFGAITKYSKKNNGPVIRSVKLYSKNLGNHLSLTHKYVSKNKKVIKKKIKPYRTDFYCSPEGKYKFVTVRYKDMLYSATKGKYVINQGEYQCQKSLKQIDDSWEFVCSMHRDELIGIVKSAGKKKIYDASTEGDGDTLYHDGNHYEVLKFTATNNDNTGVFEVKPIYCYCKKQLMPTIGTCIKIQKFATDVLGNLYVVNDNVLKFEF